MKLCNDLVCFLVTVTNLLEQNELPTATKLSARTYFDHELRKMHMNPESGWESGAALFQQLKKSESLVV